MPGYWAWTRGIGHAAGVSGVDGSVWCGPRGRLAWAGAAAGRIARPWRCSPETESDVPPTLRNAHAQSACAEPLCRSAGVDLGAACPALWAAAFMMPAQRQKSVSGNSSRAPLWRMRSSRCSWLRPSLRSSSSRGTSAPEGHASTWGLSPAWTKVSPCRIFP